ncbi:MAG: hypothetical protein ABI398_00605 [Devosia sp.]
MSRIRYDIVPAPDGWRVVCDGVAGSAYSEQSAAVLDTLAAAETLIKRGDKVEVRLLELDGPSQVWRSLQPQDAALYR